MPCILAVCCGRPPPCFSPVCAGDFTLLALYLAGVSAPLRCACAHARHSAPTRCTTWSVYSGSRRRARWLAGLASCGTAHSAPPHHRGAACSATYCAGAPLHPPLAFSLFPPTTPCRPTAPPGETRRGHPIPRCSFRLSISHFSHSLLHVRGQSGCALRPVLAFGSETLTRAGYQWSTYQAEIGGCPPG